MLSYVFWHRPIPGAEGYESSLSAFHRTLAAHAPAGFLGSASFGYDSTPWDPQPGYLDWYAVDDFTGLGALNEAAVAGARKAPHDQVARLTGSGAGGLFGLAAGRVSFGQATFGTWLAKPAGASYAAFVKEAAALLDPSTMALWQRQMSLGPGLEFCILSPRRIEVPAHFETAGVELRRVWSEPASAI